MCVVVKCLFTCVTNLLLLPSVQVLSRHDNDVDTPDGVVTETRIKVLNLRHRILTYWTVAKLEMKLVQMRDMYQVICRLPVNAR